MVHLLLQQHTNMYGEWRYDYYYRYKVLDISHKMEYEMTMNAFIYIHTYIFIMRHHFDDRFICQKYINSDHY